MSHSPTETTSLAPDPATPYHRNWARLEELIRGGRSLSGRERNCCFLNMGNGHFATVSASVGWDFPDDGRAIGLTDWDQDGDLDVWVTNRTAPRVRYLRNDAATDHAFLALRLRGTRANRDAIGTRVEVTAGGRTLRKTLRAGEGFLSQSSKWLHFGLGAANRIDRVTVRWARGDPEEIEGLLPNRHYRIEQGVRSAQEWESPRRSRLDPSPLEPAGATGQASLWLAQPVPLPSLPSLEQHRGKRVLLNLWAHWCRPCLRELEDFARNEERLRQAGIVVVALSVDGLVRGERRDRAATKRALARMRFPFPTGEATARFVEKLQLIHSRLFAQPLALPVPTSFLIDEQGRLVAIHRGAIETARLLEDKPARQGRWLTEPRPFDIWGLAWDLVDAGFEEDGAHYGLAHKDRVPAAKLAQLLAHIGNQFMRKRRVGAALEHFRRALDSDPENMVALNNLAWELATNGDPGIRNGAEALRYAERALLTADADSDPGLLDTLAAAHAETGDFERAQELAQSAAFEARELGQMRRAEGIEARLNLYRRNRPFHSRPVNR